MQNGIYLEVMVLVRYPFDKIVLYYVMHVNIIRKRCQRLYSDSFYVYQASLRNLYSETGLFVTVILIIYCQLNITESSRDYVLQFTSD